MTLRVSSSGLDQNRFTDLLGSAMSAARDALATTEPRHEVREVTRPNANGFAAERPDAPDYLLHTQSLPHFSVPDTRQGMVRAHTVRGLGRERPGIVCTGRCVSRCKDRSLQCALGRSRATVCDTCGDSDARPIHSGILDH